MNMTKIIQEWLNELFSNLISEMLFLNRPQKGSRSSLTIYFFLSGIVMSTILLDQRYIAPEIGNEESRRLVSVSRESCGLLLDLPRGFWHLGFPFASLRREKFVLSRLDISDARRSCRDI